MKENISPLVSICCITYNQAPYIRQCLEGFIMQKTNFSIEIIIHDDASTDGTQDIIKEYKKKYPHLIKAIFQSKNQYSNGVKRILATFVFPHTKGKYIALCEGDDYWTDPLKLQKQVDFLEKKTDFTMSFHGAQIKRTNNEIGKEAAPMYIDIKNKEYTSKELFEKWVAPTASMVFRKDILNYDIIKHPAVLNSDIIMVLLAADKGKIYGFSEQMSVYRIHEGGVTWNIDMNTMRLKEYPIHYRFIKRTFKKVPSKIINKKIASTYRHLAHYYKDEKDYLNLLIAFFKKVYYLILSAF